MVCGNEELIGQGRGGRVETGRVAKVLVNARSVAPNRRATRRRIAFRAVAVDMKIELAVLALENCYFILTRSLQLKSRSFSRISRLETSNIFLLADAHLPRLKLNSNR